MTHKSGRSAFQYALNRVQALSAKHSEQAEIISLGATAWAYGITPEMMDVFGKIASSARITPWDILRLTKCGIENRAIHRPWHDADENEIWEIIVPGEAILCRADGDGDFHPVFGHHYYATIANGSNRIGNARRIWPETGGHDD